MGPNELYKPVVLKKEEETPYLLGKKWVEIEEFHREGEATKSSGIEEKILGKNIVLDEYEDFLYDCLQIDSLFI